MSDTSLSNSSLYRYATQASAEQFVDQKTALVEEVATAISINGINHAVMMTTPIKLTEFALGFALSEGLIRDANDVYDLTTHHVPGPFGSTAITIDLTLSARCFNAYKRNSKVRLGASGCGLCGTDSIEHAFGQLEPLAERPPLDLTDLNDLSGLLNQHQTLGRETGAIHAALLLSPDQTPVICMEDIGRHNALDKVIGYALLNKIELHNYSVLMSSRCSVELVQKAVRAKLSRLIHLASPSALAVAAARSLGLTLVHLPKHDPARIYAAPIQPLQPSQNNSTPAL